MLLTAQQLTDLADKGWVPVDPRSSLCINAELFKQGILSFLDPNGYDFSGLEDSTEFSIGQNRRVRFATRAGKKVQSSGAQSAIDSLNAYLDVSSDFTRRFEDLLRLLKSEPENFRVHLDGYLAFRRASDKSLAAVLNLGHKKFQKPQDFKSVLSQYSVAHKALDTSCRDLLVFLKQDSKKLPPSEAGDASTKTLENCVARFTDALDVYLSVKRKLDEQAQLFSDSYVTPEPLAEVKKDLQRFFGSEYEDPSTYLLNPDRRGERYFPVVQCDLNGKVMSGLYIHPEHIGDPSASATPGFSGYTHFHTENCMVGSEFKCKTKNDSTRFFLKHDVEFYEGERIVKIISQLADNSYERLQFEDVRLMAIQMRALSRKDETGKPLAVVTHHLPWLDYILSGVLLFERGKMEYPALLSLSQLMIAKKGDHEEKLLKIYQKQGLECKFVSPFDNLLDPKIPITAESVLKQLEVARVDAEQVAQPSQSDEKIQQLYKFLNLQLAVFDQMSSPLNLNMGSSILISEEIIAKLIRKSQGFDEQAFVKKYLTRLTANTYCPEQQIWWDKLANLKEPETLDDLLSLANPLVMAQSALGEAPCSFVTTQARAIQVKYAALNRASPGLLPGTTCFSCLPALATSHRTKGATFYFDYADHAAQIVELFQPAFNQALISNMAASLTGNPVIELSAALLAAKQEREQKQKEKEEHKQRHVITRTRSCSDALPLTKGNLPTYFQLPPAAPAVAPSSSSSPSPSPGSG